MDLNQQTLKANNEFVLHPCKYYIGIFHPCTLLTLGAFTKENELKAGDPVIVEFVVSDIGRTSPIFINSIRWKYNQWSSYRS